jgi:hypothetical protein
MASGSPPGGYKRVKFFVNISGERLELLRLTASRPRHEDLFGLS